VGDTLALAFFATCRLAKQFLQAMAGVESMTVAINPADNSLMVVIELLLWMQQTTRDYLWRVELVGLQGAAIVSKNFSGAASGLLTDMRSWIQDICPFIQCVHSICTLAPNRD
jgi:hypothetical protein